MNDEYIVRCVFCGSNTFELENTGIHLKAICKNCDRPVNNTMYPHFIKQLEELEDEERATEAQIKAIRYRAYHEEQYLSKTDAGDIIGIFERAKGEKNGYK